MLQKMFFTSRGNIFPPRLISLKALRWASINRQLHMTTKDFLSDNLVFNNAQEVFGHRTTSELLRAHLVLHACAVESIVKHSHTLMQLGERLMGPSLLGKAISPFYFQFVAGNSEAELKDVTNTLRTVGINLMVAPMLETDIGLVDTGKYLYDGNLDKTLKLIDISSRCKMIENQLKPVCQTKISAHINADVLFKISSVYERLSFEKRRSLIEAVSAQMKKLKHSSVGVPELTFSHLNIPPSDLKEFNKSLPRLAKLGELSRRRKVILAVDAEYSYANSAISLLTLALMVAFNDELPVIWNTYQGYLKSTKDWLEHDFRLIQSFEASFGAKMVRGAYMEKERDYAKNNNTPDPVNDTYELTNASYDGLVEYFVPYVAASPHKCQMVVATHNEASVLNATQQMKKHGIPKSSSALLFAQIYGMAENISVPLAKAHYSVYKSVPFGNITEVMPYLSRRANENRAVFRGARRERALLSQELWRRTKGVKSNNLT